MSQRTVKREHTATTIILCRVYWSEHTGTMKILYHVYAHGYTGKTAARHPPDNRDPPSFLCRARAHGKFWTRYRVPGETTHGKDPPSPSTVVKPLRVPQIVFTVRPEIGHTAKRSFPCISPPCARCRVRRTAKTLPCVFPSSPCVSGTRQCSVLP